MVGSEFDLNYFIVLKKSDVVPAESLTGADGLRSMDSCRSATCATAMWPPIYYMMNQWLDSFVDRIAIDLWLFPAACLLVTVIALFTVSFHTIKAARATPVKSLRYE